MSSVALILSGRPGECDKCVDNIMDTIVNPLSADVFMYISKGKNDDIDFSPKAIEIEDSDTKTPDRFSGHESVYHMHRKIKACFELIDGHYDWVIKFRPDCTLDRRIDLSVLDRDGFNIPVGGDWCGGINDVLCIGSYDNMNYYCHLLDYMDAHLKNSPLHPETLLRNHLRHRGLLITRFDTDIYLRKYYKNPIDRVCSRKYNV